MERQKIVFETIPREDLKDANNNKSKALSKIKVYNENNTLIKQIGFDFGTSSYSRLQLDNVAILDIMDNSKVQQFSFEYYGNAKSILIPSLNSNPINNSVDHWGYYNGKSNLSKIPRANYSLIIPNTSTDFGNANRASDGDASKIGMLKKITYPTQGSTTIAYEPNTIHFDNYASIPFFMKSQHASGYSIFLNSGTKDCNTGPVSGTFTVPQAIVAAKITWVLSTNSSDDLSSFKLSTTGSAPYIINEFAQNTTNGEMITDLPAGTYYYTLYPGCVTQTQNVTAQASFKIEQPVTPSGGIDLSVGGNRVSKVIDYDGTSAYHERNFVYENANLLDIPFYVSTIQTGKGIGSEGGLCGQIICGTTYILGENNVHAWDGFHVEYLKVTENHGANGNNGKKIYRYEPNVFVGGPIATSPYPSTFNLNWRSGNLLIDETYRNESSVFTIMQEVQKNYTPLTIFPITQNGIKIGRKLTCPSGSYATSNPDLYFNTALQPVFSDKFAISSETSKYYAENNTLSSTKNYTYNNDWLLQKTSTTNSKNQVVDIINYYPNDFNNGIANTQINTLKNKHIIGIPLKVIKNINNKTVDGVLINTDAVGNQTEIYHFENNNLITHNHNPSTFFDTNFYLYETRKYSSKGNIVEITPRNSTSKTYVWGYKHSYPIAEVINATKAQVEAQIGNLETIAEYTQDAQISAIGNTLRTNIPTAFVTSGVLTSGVGLKSIKSANDISSYFEYDSFNRLKIIRDNSNYIVKNYTYRYAEATGGGSCTVAAPTISATPASIGCNAVLTASGCSGTVTWSNSQTGNTITVPSVTSTTYTATCTTTCTSVASSPITGLTYPTGWNATNIGSPAINGCLVLGNNTIRMQASPSGGIGGTDNDVHYYLNKQFSGNVTIMAKISSMTNTANIRAGIIFKSGLGTKDIFFSIVQDGNNTVGKLHRSAVNDPVTIWQYDNNTPAGVWLKIKKKGNTIQSYYSTASNPSINNDTNWTEFLPNLFGSAPSITWGSNFQIGLTLENPPSANTSTAQVVFTNVQINDNGFISNF
ncbi:hypothetical protein [Flectobacillus major]|uniref:hypothetical protein n=1 Tax=Flectobacillus major TaxID=103 RepID=UPI0004081EF2|nr:hypothetical protein [Flectobacillus major]